MANLREVSVAQSCPTLGDPVDCCCLPGSSVHGIFQAKMQKIVAIPFSRWSSHPGIKPKEPKSGSPALKVKVKELVTHVSYFATPWTTCSPPVSSVHGTLQAIPFSRGTSQRSNLVGRGCVHLFTQRGRVPWGWSIGRRRVNLFRQRGRIPWGCGHYVWL